MGFLGGLFGGGGGEKADSYGYQYLPQSENFLYGNTLSDMLKSNPGMAKQFFYKGKLTDQGSKFFQQMGVNPSKIKSPDDVINKFANKYGTQGAASVKDYQKISSDLNNNNLEANKDIANSYNASKIDPASDYQSPEMERYQGFQSGEYNPYSFSTKDISNIPDEVYKGAQTMQEEAAQRSYEKSLAQQQGAFADQGLSRTGGSAQKSNTSLGRMLAENFSNIARTNALDKAGAQIDAQKFNANLDFNKQQAQAGENYKSADFGENSRRYGANLGEQARQFNNNFKSNNAQFGSNQRETQRQFNANARENRQQFGATNANNIAMANKDYFIKRNQAKSDALANQTNRAYLPQQMMNQYFSNSKSYQPGQGGSSLGNFLAGAGKIAANVAPLFI